MSAVQACWISGIPQEIAWHRGKFSSSGARLPEVQILDSDVATSWPVSGATHFLCPCLSFLLTTAVPASLGSARPWWGLFAFPEAFPCALLCESSLCGSQHPTSLGPWAYLGSRCLSHSLVQFPTELLLINSSLPSRSSCRCPGLVEGVMCSLPEKLRSSRSSGKAGLHPWGHTSQVRRYSSFSGVMCEKGAGSVSLLSKQFYSNTFWKIQNSLMDKSLRF